MSIRPVRKDVPWTAEDDYILQEMARLGESVNCIAQKLDRIDSDRDRDLRLNVPIAKTRVLFGGV